MSTIIIIQQANAVHLITDAGSYDYRGNLVDIRSKVLTLPAGAALTWRGFGGEWPQMLYRRLYDVPSFDQMARELQGIAHYVYGRCIAEMPDILPDHDQHFEITLAGWSETAKRPACVQLSSRAGEANQRPFWRAQATAAFELLVAESFSVAPGVDLKAALGRSIGPDDIDALDAERDGLALIEAQRALQGDQTSLGHRVAGGAAELTTITREGVASKVLRRWPDVIGHPVGWVETEAPADVRAA